MFLVHLHKELFQIKGIASVESQLQTQKLGDFCVVCAIAFQDVDFAFDYANRGPYFRHVFLCNDHYIKQAFFKLLRGVIIIETDLPYGNIHYCACFCVVKIFVLEFNSKFLFMNRIL